MTRSGVDSPQPWSDVAPMERLSRSGRAVAMLEAEIDAWLAVRRADPRLARFAGHFRALDAALSALLDVVRVELAHVDPTAPSGWIYERCRVADRRLEVVRRLYRWYGEKYDQRLDDAAVVLQAADEIARSCWAGTFACVGAPAPTGPLTYFDARFDAVANPRSSVPADLRAPRDALVGELVRELPIPTIALPSVARTEPWWLVLIAHETGHHVQHDLPEKLVDRTRDLLADVAGRGGADDLAADCWSAWGQEVFADSFAAFAIGPAAAWAVEELQHATPAVMAAAPSLRQKYPPPVVRAALLGELARAVGASQPGPGSADMERWLTSLGPDDVQAPTRAVVATHTRIAADVAAALQAMDVAGVPLRTVCGWDAGLHTANGPVARWARALRAARPLVTGRQSTAAARQGIAAGVVEYQRTVRAADAVGRERLAANLPALLASCGPPGTLAAAPPADVDGAAARLAERLRTADVAGDRP